MPEALEREVIFDIAPALSALGDLDNEFEQSARRVESLYSDAIANALSDVRIEDVDASPVETAVSEAIEEGAATDAVIAADATAVEGGVTDAIVAGSDEPAVIEGDASNVTEEIGTAIDAADTEVALESPDGGPITDAINQTVDAANLNPEITPTIDDSQAESDIASLANFAENLNPEITPTIDTSDAESSLSSLGDTAGNAASGGVSALGAAAGSLTDDLFSVEKGGEAAAAGSEQAAAGATKLSVGGLAAAAGLTAAVAGLVKFTSLGAEVIGIQQQFTATFGDFADEVQNVDVAGINQDLSELAISLGVDDEAMFSATTRAGALFQTFGAGRKEAAGFTKELSSAAAVITSVNPAAGNLTTVLEALTTAVATGKTRGLKRLGIEITPAEIEAAANAIGKTTESLTATERQAIFVDEIMKQLTGRFGEFGDEIASRQENAQVKLAATKERVNNLIEALSVQLAPPVLDILTELTPLIEASIPVAVALGKALAAGFRIGADTAALLVGAIGDVAESFGHIIESANDIPLLGRLIGDDAGKGFIEFGKTAKDTAQNMHDAARGGGELTASLNATTPAANEATGAVGGLTEVTGALTPAQQAATDATNAFVNTAIGQLPTAATAIQDFQSGVSKAYGEVASAAEGGGQKLADAQATLNDASDPQRFIDNLNKQAAGVREWRMSLETIADAGFGAVLESLIAAGPEQGGQLAASLAQGIREGKPELAQAATDSLGVLRSEVDATGLFLQGPGATVIANATGVAAGAGTDAWTERYKLTHPTATEMDAAAAIATEKGAAVAVITGGVADQASVAYAEKFLIRHPTETEVTGAEAEVSGSTVPGDAATVASSATDQYGTNLDLKSPTSAGMQLAAQTLLTGNGALQVAALSAGRSVGSQFSAGIAAGIDNNSAVVKAAARQIVQDAKDASDKKAGSFSPSKLFMEVGRDIGAGLAVGMTSQTSTVAKAAEQLVTASVGAFDNVAAATPTLTPRVAAAATVGGAAGVNNSTLNFDVTVNVNGAMTPAAARAAADTFASEAEVALMRRNVIARVRAV